VRDHPLPFDDRAALELGAIVLVGHTPHLGHVLAQHPVARVRHPQGKLPVVGQDHQAFGVEVEAAHREDALGDLASEQIQDGRAPLGILGRGDEAARLVEQDVAQPLRRLEALPVDLHRIRAQLGLVSELRGAAVDGDPALADQIFRLATGTNAGARDELL
jgi:hypothetical protein